MLKRREALWTFVQVEGVEPTKQTRAEARSSGCGNAQGQLWHQSEDGSRFVESMDDGSGDG